MDELKKCPFCGAQTDSHIDFMMRPGHSSNAVQQVVDAWNRRTDNG